MNDKLLKKLNSKRECEKCWHYNMIDSGYGECRRFPPQWLVRWKWWKNRIFRWAQFFECRYPEVPWDNKPCGEYEETK